MRRRRSTAGSKQRKRLSELKRNLRIVESGGSYGCSKKGDFDRAKMAVAKATGPL